MIEGIKAWLNEKGTYGAGVDLFVQACPGSPLVDLFTGEGESAFKMKKLHQALQQLLQHSGELKNTIGNQDPGTITPARQVETIKIEGVNKPTLAPSKHPGRWSAAPDAVEKDLHDAWHPLFLEMNNLQARIYDVAKAGQADPEQKKAAGIMAHRILNLAQQCKQIYKKRDQYFTTGQVPTDPPAVDLALDPQTAFLKLKNAERYVREFQGKLKKNASDEKATEKLQHWQNVVAQYKKQLNIP